MLQPAALAASGWTSFDPAPANVPHTRKALSATSALFFSKMIARIESELGKTVKELRAKDVVGPPEGCEVLTPGPHRALTGLRAGVFPGYNVDKWEMRKSFDATIIPRLPLLTPKLRAHETAFAEQFANDVHGTVKHYRRLVDETKRNVFSVDLAKRCYGPWGKDRHPSGDDAKDQARVRATANLALHQTAVAIAKTAFLQRLDELVELSADDPTRRVMVIVGGSGAGKGQVMSLLNVGMPGFKAGAVFDAAGEGEGRECDDILKECRRRGLHCDFVYVHKPMTAAAKRVVERTETSARVVDVLPMVRGHIQGAEVMRAFAEGSALRSQQKTGKARCYGYSVIYRSDPDPKGLRFPFYQPLDHDGELHVPKPEHNEAQAVLLMLNELALAKRNGLSDDAVRGALFGLAVVWPDYFDSLGLGLFSRRKPGAA